MFLFAAVLAGVIFGGCKSDIAESPNSPKPEDEQGGEAGETAIITGLTLTPGGVIAVNDEGVFDSGTKILVVNLPDGTGDVEVRAQTGVGVTAEYEPVLTSNKLTLKTGGLTTLHIIAKENEKKDGKYTVIFSVGSVSKTYTRKLIPVLRRTTYSIGDEVDKENDLFVYLRETDGITEPVGRDDFEVSGSGTDAAGKFNAAGVQTVTITYSDDSSLRDEYKVWVMEAVGSYESELEFFYADHDGANTNADGTMRRNANGDFVIVGAAQDKIIHTIRTVGTLQPKEYLLGRKDNEAITLNFDINGRLLFRAPLTSGEKRGFILVSTAEELSMINKDAGTLSDYYALTADVDLLGNPDDDADYYNRKAWQPIGKDAAGNPTGFTGIFDGGGHTISGLSIKPGDTAANTDRNGFFAQVGDGAANGVVVRNIIVAGKIDVNKNHTGGVAGFVDGGGTLTACSNTGTVTGGDHTGGVAGFVNGGTLTACSNTGTVRGGTKTGGVAGYVYSGTLTACYNNGGTVTGSNDTGGVAGVVVEMGTLTACYNNGGTVTGSTRTGGVAGDAEGTLTACYNTGDVDGEDHTGGVAGLVAGTLTACYNTGGTVTGSTRTGGVAGAVNSLRSSVKACYNTGDVTSNTAGTNSDTGGVAGFFNGGSVTGCYNTGTVMLGIATGGVAGKVNRGSVTACYNLGNVGSGGAVGGVAGSVSGGSVTACYSTGNLTGMYGSATVGGVAWDAVGSVTACYWNSNIPSPPANGIGSPASDTNAASFSGAAAFPNVSSPLAHAEWGTGDGSGSGKYWKAGTTAGTQLPKLWWE
jgi:hypothetical protein